MVIDARDCQHAGISFPGAMAAWMARLKAMSARCVDGRGPARHADPAISKSQIAGGGIEKILCAV
ncbi:hypothetical protein [Cupriavidus respiraculi]|uniref:hypothetical protein n=1 Tax=Cupriavidus respiraculi TaxID=195930 RepID=UPI001CC8038F|nr:hypothetical protein [Cupriavidus respiraculi]